ncbi:MAG: M20/M25/M40 family metallo-hydrolase [Candidatus Rokuibacteriota bacterium]
MWIESFRIVQITADEAPHGDSPAAPLKGPVPDAVAQVARGGPAMVPVISTGATDSAHLRQAGIHAYGLKPFPLMPEDVGLAHGPDERMPIDALEYVAKFLCQTSWELAR